MIDVTFNQNRRLAYEEGMRASGRAFPPYSICVAFTLPASTEAGSVEAALNAIARRHPALRASFAPIADHFDRSAAVDAYLRTGVCPPGLYGQTIHEQPAICVVADARRFADVDACLQGMAGDLPSTTFAYERAPLVSARLFSVADGSRLLLLVLPHLICDRRSVEVLTAELTAHLQPESALPREPQADAYERPLDAALESRARHNGALTAATDYWHARWDDFGSAQIERSDIPFAWPVLRSPTRLVAAERVTMDDRVSERLKAFAQANRMTLYMLCVAALGRMLRNVLGLTRMVIWSNLPNRVAPGSESAIGWFVNSHILGIDLGAATSASTLLSHARCVVAEALEQQHLPLGLLWYREQRCPVRGIRIGLDMTHHGAETPGADDGVRRIGLPSGRQGIVDLDFEIHVKPRTIVLTATYSVDLLAAYAVRQLLTRLQAVLAGIMDEWQRECVRVH